MGLREGETQRQTIETSKAQSKWKREVEEREVDRREKRKRERESRQRERERAVSDERRMLSSPPLCVCLGQGLVGWSTGSRR